jgi:hypothetical protein
VGERCSSERSEAQCPDENKRHGNEQGIKKDKLVVHITPRVHPKGVAGVGRHVCSITDNLIPIPTRFRHIYSNRKP